MRSAYKCRIYPTPEQKAVLDRTFGCVRVVWNQTLVWRTQRYRIEGVNTSFPDSNAHLTELKRHPEFAWLSDVSSVPCNKYCGINMQRFNGSSEARPGIRASRTVTGGRQP